MFVRNTVAALAAVGALTTASAASAQTEAVSFSIENNSSSTIVSIYYGKSTSDYWSDDILSGVISPGETVEITIDDNLPDCNYDFSYTFDDGEEYTEYRVDMCAIDGTVHEFTN